MCCHHWGIFAEHWDIGEQALSAEMIATSTLLSYDVYRHYFNPGATSKEVVAASRYFILFWAIFSAGLASIFKAVGIVMISL